MPERKAFETWLIAQGTRPRRPGWSVGQEWWDQCVFFRACGEECRVFFSERGVSCSGLSAEVWNAFKRGETFDMGNVHTCNDCRHMGGEKWDTGTLKLYYCGQSVARRRAAIKPTGDLADDFMRNFRASFDAYDEYRACSFFEAKSAAAAETRRD